MKKYKLINTKTKEETICDKVTIDGFDYYVSDEKCIQGDLCYDIEGLPGHKNNKYVVQCLRTADDSYWNRNCKKIIATNNPNIDIPKVIHEVEKLALSFYRDNPTDKKDAEYRYNTDIHAPKKRKAFIKGYKKAKEQFGNSEEDMIEFAEFVSKYPDKNRNYKGEMLHAQSKYDGAERTIELLQIWKEQQPKIVYYE